MPSSFLGAARRHAIALLLASAAPGLQGCGGGPGCDGTVDCSGTCNGTATVDACGTCDADASNDCGTTFTAPGAWSCAAGTSCQDVYDVTLPAGAVAMLAVTAVTGASVPRLAVFGPGAALTSASLLTGVAADRRCVGQDDADSVTFKAVTAGTYRVAVGRDWGSSLGESGTYRVTLTGDHAFAPPVRTADDAVSGLAATRCGYLYTVSAGWSCAAGVSCQDVYDLEALGAASVTVTVSALTGSSVARLAVVQGSSLAGTNLLNGSATDRRCGGQDTGDGAGPVALPAAGTYRFAVGRDWGASAGAAGTYAYAVSTTGAVLVPLGATVDDGASERASASCP